MRENKSLIEALLRENEVLRAENKMLRAENEALRATIAKLEAKIEELERRLGLNSGNSGKPPSSDGLSKPATRTQSLREKSGKKPGGQRGHSGSTLKQVKNPDVIEQHAVASCPDCKIDLTHESVKGIVKRQIFDIPKITKPIVTEHQFEVKQCPGCHKRVESPSQNFVNSPVQYGNNVKALVTLFHVGQLIPTARVAEIMHDGFGLDMSPGTVENIIKEGARCVTPAVEKIEEQIIAAEVKHADESGVRFNGKTGWLHSTSNEKLTIYRASEKRGDVDQRLTGYVVHDHFVSYYSKLENVVHALCNAHHLRELKAVEEIDKEPWAKDMKQLLLKGHNTKQQNPQLLTEDWLAQFRRDYDLIIESGLRFHQDLGHLSKPARGRIKRRPGHNLLLRLKNRVDDVLRFLYHAPVPFTNNNAEQAVRMVKVKQKISGGFRTRAGIDKFLTVRSYLATAKKQSFNLLDSLTTAFQKNPLVFGSG